MTRDETRSREKTAAGMNRTAERPDDTGGKIPPAGSMQRGFSIRSLLRNWQRKLCTLGMAGGMLGLLLPWLTTFWLGFDVFSQFTVHFLIITVACALGLSLPRHGFFLAALLVLLGGFSVGGWAMLHKSTGFSAQTSERNIRVMSFNTWLRNLDVDAIRREVLRQKPDVLGVVEFQADKRVLFSQLRSHYPYQADCSEIPHCYLALFSRWPLEKVRARHLWMGPPYLHVLVKAPSGPVHVFVVHTLRFPWLGSQYAQVRAMARLVRRVKGAKIVMGDFNATPFSVMLHTFIRGSGLKRQTWLPTWPAWNALMQLPQLAIDHVFISSEFERVDGPWIGDNAGSDHFPVIVTLRRRVPRHK